MNTQQNHELGSPLLDLRNTTNHPISLRYSEIYQMAVVDGDFEQGRAQPGLSTKDATPFVIAARKAADHGIERADAQEVIAHCLADYYCKVQPANAAQWLGLDKTDNQLAELPPWAAVFPWRARSAASYRKAYENAALSENMAVGRNIGIEDGWLFCGPVSKNKIDIEAQRILYVLRKIRDEGYRRSDGVDGDVRASALVNESHEWRWLITAGNHRASAAAALGYPSIPVRINLVISRSDVAYWKHVVEGLFSQEQALSVFDNFFYARQIPILNNWLQDKQTIGGSL